MTQRHAHIATVFPENQTPLAIGALWRRVQEMLLTSTGEEPQLVHPNAGALVFLVEGDTNLIAEILEIACGNDRWLIAQVEKETANFGLARAAGWIHSRANPPTR